MTREESDPHVVGFSAQRLSVWCPVLPVSSWSRSCIFCIFCKSHFQNNGTARTTMPTRTSKTRSSTSCTPLTLTLLRPTLLQSPRQRSVDFVILISTLLFSIRSVWFIFPFLIAQQHMPAVVISNAISPAPFQVLFFPFLSLLCCCCCVFLCEPKN